MNRLATLITLMLGLLPLLATAGNGVPKKSVILQGIDIDSMQVRLDESDLQPLEGIWYYPNEEMTLGIERYRGEHNIGYRIILLDSPDINVMPGTVIGYIAASAVDSKYQLWLYSQRDKVTLLKPLECVATLSSPWNVWRRSTQGPPPSPLTRRTGRSRCVSTSPVSCPRCSTA